MKIITLTLNPAIDVHCQMEHLELYKENYGTHVTRQSGGKGINLSRALLSYGIENTAITVVGTENGEEFKKGLETDGISYLAINAKGRIRENLTIHSPHAPETRISFEGFQTEDSILQQIEALMSLDEETVVAFTGRIPSGLSKGAVLSFLNRIKERGVGIVIDCNSFSMEELIALKPLMIKPNEQEIAQLSGKESGPEEAFGIAEELHKKGIEHVLISFGEKGIVYAGATGRARILVPKIPVVSTIGAGDSTVAGFVAGLMLGLPIYDTLRLSAAFGTAACETCGTNPPLKPEIDSLFDQIKCE